MNLGGGKYNPAGPNRGGVGLAGAVMVAALHDCLGALALFAPAARSDLSHPSVCVGRHVAHAVHAFLGSHRWHERSPVPIVCAPPVQWVTPSAIDSDAHPPPRNRFTWRVSGFCGPTDLIVRQGSRFLWRCRYRQLIPGRPLRASAEWIGRVDFSGEPVAFELNPAA
jgi:hypothetical protein